MQKDHPSFLNIDTRQHESLRITYWPDGWAHLAIDTGNRKAEIILDPQELKTLSSLLRQATEVTKHEDATHQIRL